MNFILENGIEKKKRGRKKKVTLDNKTTNDPITLDSESKLTDEKVNLEKKEEEKENITQNNENIFEKLDRDTFTDEDITFKKDNKTRFRCIYFDKVGVCQKHYSKKQTLINHIKVL